MSENNNQENTIKIDINNNKSSMTIKKELISSENDKKENKDLLNLKTISSGRKTLNKNSPSILKLLDKKEETLENSNTFNNLRIPSASKTTMLKPMIGLSKCETL